MKKSKILILIITLSFPVILYLFLRSFGQNEFALPVYFENDKKLQCNDSTVKEKSFEVLSAKQQDSLKVEDIYKADYKIIHFPNIKDSKIQTLKNELNRVLNTFDDLSISIISLKPIPTALNSMEVMDTFLPSDKSKTYLYPLNDKDKFINCLYAFPTQEWNGNHPAEETIEIDHTLVLLDEENKIRGYYDGYETKEVDRLILEIRVLLSNK